MSLCFGVPEEWLMTRIRFTKAVQIVAEIQPIQVISGTKMVMATAMTSTMMTILMTMAGVDDGV